MRIYLKIKMRDLNINRLNNLSWTIAKNHNFIPNFSIFSLEEDIKINIYKSSLLGFSYGKFHIEEIYSYLDYLVKDNPNPEDYYKITELILENYFWDIYELKRPGIVEYRDYTCNLKFDKYKFRRPVNLSEELEFAFYSRKLKRVPVTNERVVLLLNDIMNKNKIKNTSSLIMYLDKIIRNHFHLNLDFKYEQNLEKSVKNSDEKDKSIRDIKPKVEFSHNNKDILDKDEIEAAEFNKSSFLFEEKDLDNEDKEEISNLVESNSNDSYLKNLAEEVYGKSILNKINNYNLEQELCTGIHDNIQILITEGEYGTSLNEQYRESENKFNKKENLDHFNKNILIYKRSITKLRDVLKKELMTDLNESKFLSTNGRLEPSLIWKVKYLNDNKIFNKEFKDELGTVSVDILLDSSASQIERQELVAAQGFIIAEALSDLNIPTRVTSFNNFYNVLVLKSYRDYFDSNIKNKKIFEYKASGSNRDGLAIKTISHYMEKTNFQRKILIVLSDGKPNDKLNLKIIGNINKKSKDYIRDEAIKDSAKEVFLSRNKDNIVLGVFTGDAKDLPSEKKIYGTDFAYISDINRFSDIVGNFIRNVFKNSID